MNIKFRNDNVTGCAKATKPTKVERKEVIARVNIRLKQKNKEMGMLSEMYGNYDYNQQHMNEMIGACYISITQLRGELKGLKNA